MTYSLSFMLILLAVISALTMWGGATWLVGLLLLYAPYHMYRQLRGTYALGRTGAALRTVALSFVALTVLMMFGVTLGAMALAG